MSLLMLMLLIYKMLLSFPPPHPCLVKSNSGMELTMAAVIGGAYLANDSIGDGSHHRRLWWVRQKTITISRGNYPDDDGAEINGGRRHTLLAKDMIGKQ